MRLSSRIIALSAVAVLPALAIQGWHEVALRQSRIAGVEQEARRFALQSASEVARLLEGARGMLAAVGEAHLRNGTFPGCSEGLAALNGRMERYGSIGIADAEGNILCSSNGAAPPRSIADRAYFKAALATGQFQVGEFVTSTDRPPFLPVALPIMEAGVPAIVAIASFQGAWLSANLVVAGALPPGGSVTVADRNGVIVARYPQAERFIATRIPDAFRHLVNAREAGVMQVTSQDGTHRMLAYLPVDTPPLPGLYLSAGYGTAAAFAEIDRATRRAVLMILAGLASALAAAWVFGRLALRDPVDRLLDAMRRWTAGDRGARTAATQGWEVGRLAAGFNAMADAVALREELLRQEEARLRAVLDQMPVAVVLAAIPSGRETYRNARARALLPPAGDGSGEGDDPEPLAEPLRRAVAEGVATEGLELPLRRADGSETTLSVSAAAVAAAGGERMAVAAFLDIGARRHAERQQALLTAELRHRVKNALAVVQAVAAQTLSHSETLDQFRQAFSGRLTHLARAQDALFDSADGAVELSALVASTVAPFGEIVRWQGPSVPLPAKQTLAMALVLHEMATNAAKHGALRPGAAGRVSIQWRLAEDGCVALAWEEVAERPVAESVRRGFGGKLIDRCVAHDLRGRAEQEMRREGLVWRLRFPRPGRPAEIDAAPIEMMG
jgi:two-component sensor histidine kinase